MEAFRRFMRGRYGMDSLGRVLLWGAVLFSTLAIITRLPLTYLSYALVIVELYRFFSANIYKRAGENRRWGDFKAGFSDKFKLMRNKYRDRDTHRYLKCPTCRANLRVPRGRGKISVTCPVCKTVTITKT